MCSILYRCNNVLNFWYFPLRRLKKIILISGIKRVFSFFHFVRNVCCTIWVITCIMFHVWLKLKFCVPNAVMCFWFTNVFWRLWSIEVIICNVETLLIVFFSWGFMYNCRPCLENILVTGDMIYSNYNMIIINII